MSVYVFQVDLWTEPLACPICPSSCALLSGFLSASSCEPSPTYFAELQNPQFGCFGLSSSEEIV